MPRINSRAKGAYGERELAEFLRAYGYEARRGQQFAGGSESPDVIGLPGYHIEVKRVEAGNPYKWMEQAVRDTGRTPAGTLEKTPVVFHRRNRKPWLVVMLAEDFMELVGDGNGSAVPQSVAEVGQPDSSGEGVGDSSPQRVRPESSTLVERLDAALEVQARRRAGEEDRAQCPCDAFRIYRLCTHIL